MTVEQLNEYSADLQAKVDAGEPNFASNHDCAHNAAVMECMLNNASSITMYCGRFSPFRKDFYTRINQENPDSYNPAEFSEIKSDGRYNAPENSCCSSYSVGADVYSSSTSTSAGPGLGDVLRERVVVALEGFLQREGTRMEVIAENPDSNMLESSIFSDSLVFRSFSNKIRFTTLTEDYPLRGKLFHFTYTDPETGMIRIEADAESHEGTCSFFAPDETGIRRNLQNTFANVLTWKEKTFSL